MKHTTSGTDASWENDSTCWTRRHRHSDIAHIGASQEERKATPPAAVKSSCGARQQLGVWAKPGNTSCDIFRRISCCVSPRCFTDAVYLCSVALLVGSPDGQSVACRKSAGDDVSAFTQPPSHCWRPTYLSMLRINTGARLRRL